MNRLEILWQGYRQGLLNQAELEELLQLMQTDDGLIATEIDTLLQQETAGTPPPGEKEAILGRLRQQMHTPDAPAEKGRPARVHWIRRFRWVAAATFLLLSGTILWFTIGNNNKAITGTGRPSAPVTDAAPGKSGAVLTLADGTQIVLDTAVNGAVAQQGASRLLLQDGQLSYLPLRSAAQQATMAMNTISTPNGRQFQVVLPDGSKVWLNAASSLTYPVEFTGNERAVSITGEAYFEVSKIPVSKGGSIPFLVKAGNTQVEVLGTHFNVNAYEGDRSTSTTLLEGKVKVNYNAGAAPSPPTAGVILLPGRQAITGRQSAAIVTQPADVEQVVAWKNGLFNFHKTHLADVLGQLARWYDVKVEVRGSVPDRLFGGEIERSLQLSQVIKILGRMGIHCTLENGTLIVHGTTKA